MSFISLLVTLLNRSICDQ